MEFSDKSCSGLQIGELLSLWGSQQRTCREVKVLAERHIGELETKVVELNSMIAALRTLMQHCHGDSRPDCPILEGLQQPGVSATAVKKSVPDAA